MARMIEKNWRTRPTRVFFPCQNEEEARAWAQGVRDFADFLRMGPLDSAIINRELAEYLRMETEEDDDDD